MTEHDFAGPDNPIGDLTLPRTARTGARNHALSGKAARVSQNSLTTMDITVVTGGFTE
ncbi:hypothetical protein [Amycolatopsis sp. RTGN1]|uniref:hypothetical protein n=1 Tax=Amycolatopsis ponsaeliensis TaxID=2992142 RepID=UPI00254DB8B0|nr:hypothetical protein [Amycolatopsis sp. RTGN1]